MKPYRPNPGSFLPCVRTQRSRPRPGWAFAPCWYRRALQAGYLSESDAAGFYE